MIWNNMSVSKSQDLTFLLKLQLSAENSFFFSLVLPLYIWSRLLFKTTEFRADECAVLLMALIFTPLCVVCGTHCVCGFLSLSTADILALFWVFVLATSAHTVAPYKRAQRPLSDKIWGKKHSTAAAVLLQKKKNGTAEGHGKFRRDETRQAGFDEEYSCVYAQR